MRERELVVGKSKSATPCNSTHSRDTWHMGVASGSISSWFLKFCDSCRDSIGAYKTVYITRRSRVNSRCKSFYRSGLFYYSNPGELEKRTISIRRGTRQIAGNDLQSRHISHILNKSNSAQQRKCWLGANDRHYDAMCVSWSLSNLTILRKSAVFRILIRMLFCFYFSYTFGLITIKAYVCMWQIITSIVINVYTIYDFKENFLI